jgi:hypothetical protein
LDSERFDVIAVEDLKISAMTRSARGTRVDKIRPPGGRSLREEAGALGYIA